MELVVKLTPEAARLMRTDAKNSSLERMANVLGRSGAALRPVHESIQDGELARFFVAHIQDSKVAEETAHALQGLGEVDGAYVKPAATPPGSPNSKS